MVCAVIYNVVKQSQYGYYGDIHTSFTEWVNCNTWFSNDTWFFQYILWNNNTKNISYETIIQKIYLMKQ